MLDSYVIIISSHRASFTLNKIARVSKWNINYKNRSRIGIQQRNNACYWNIQVCLLIPLPARKYRVSLADIHQYLLRRYWVRVSSIIFVCFSRRFSYKDETANPTKDRLTAPPLLHFVNEWGIELVNVIFSNHTAHFQSSAACYVYDSNQSNCC